MPGSQLGAPLNESQRSNRSRSVSADQNLLSHTPHSTVIHQGHQNTPNVTVHSGHDQYAHQHIQQLNRAKTFTTNVNMNPEDHSLRKSQTVIRETLPPIYEQGIIGTRKNIERIVHKQQVVENEIIQFVDKIVEVPYDEYVIEYYDDPEDIIQEIPVTNNCEEVIQQTIEYVGDKQIEYNQFKEVPEKVMIDALHHEDKYVDVVHQVVNQVQEQVQIDIVNKLIEPRVVHNPVRVVHEHIDVVNVVKPVDVLHKIVQIEDHLVTVPVVHERINIEKRDISHPVKNIKVVPNYIPQQVRVDQYEHILNKVPVKIEHSQLQIKDVQVPKKVEHIHIQVTEKHIAVPYDNYEVVDEVIDVTQHNVNVVDVEKIVPIEHEVLRIVENKELVDVEEVSLNITEETKQVPIVTEKEQYVQGPTIETVHHIKQYVNPDGSYRNDKLTREKFVRIWNQFIGVLQKDPQYANNQCLTQEAFVKLIAKSLDENANRQNSVIRSNP